MSVWKIVLIVVEVIASILLVGVILLQSGKEAGLGALAGNNETYMGKNKRSSLDKIMASATKWVALAWVVLTLAISLVK